MVAAATRVRFQIYFGFILPFFPPGPVLKMKKKQKRGRIFFFFYISFIPSRYWEFKEKEERGERRNEGDRRNEEQRRESGGSELG